MARNAIESDFRSSKMAAGSHFVNKIKNCFDKMAAGSHFGWDDNVYYRTRPIYLDE